VKHISFHFSLDKTDSNNYKYRIRLQIFRNSEASKTILSKRWCLFIFCLCFYWTPSTDCKHR